MHFPPPSFRHSHLPPLALTGLCCGDFAMTSLTCTSWPSFNFNCPTSHSRACTRARQHLHARHCTSIHSHSLPFTSLRFHTFAVVATTSHPLPCLTSMPCPGGHKPQGGATKPKGHRRGDTSLSPQSRPHVDEATPRSFSSRCISANSLASPLQLPSFLTMSSKNRKILGAWRSPPQKSCVYIYIYIYMYP